MMDLMNTDIGVVSIRPFFTMSILNGVKKWEIRKHSVKEGTLMLIYATKGSKNGGDWLFKEANATPNTTEPYFLDKYGYEYGDYANRFLCGKLVGYFIVDKVIKLEPNEDFYYVDDDELNINQKNTCLTMKELVDYGKGKTLYAWRISNLFIFDKPLPLSRAGLNRPPQSYCFIKSFNLANYNEEHNV